MTGYLAMDAAHVLWCAGNRRDGMTPGGFFEALIAAAFKADGENLARLANGFPGVMAAVYEFQRGGGEQALISTVRAMWPRAETTG